MENEASIKFKFRLSKRKREKNKNLHYTGLTAAIFPNIYHKTIVVDLHDSTARDLTMSMVLQNNDFKKDYHDKCRSMDSFTL